MLFEKDAKWKASTRILQRGQSGRYTGFWIAPFKIRIGFDAAEIEKAVKESDIFQQGIPSRDIAEFARTDLNILRLPGGEFSEGKFKIFDHMGKEIDRDDAWALKEI